MCRHRNPLMDPRTGLSFKRNLAYDTLHCLYLCVMNCWAKVSIWYILLSGVLGGAGGSQEERLHVNVLALRHLMDSFYAEVRGTRERALTEVNDLTMSLLGNPNDKRCKTNGGGVGLRRMISCSSLSIYFASMVLIW